MIPEIIGKQLERFTHNFPDGEVIPLNNGRYALRFSRLQRGAVVND